MTGLGLLILWTGYTGFAYGNAVRKGAAVTFSDMVLPSHRTYATGLIAAAGSKGASSQAGKNAVQLPGILGTDQKIAQPLIGPIASGDLGIINGLGNGLKNLGNTLKNLIP